MLSALSEMETPIKYSGSNSKTDKTISMLSLRRTGLHIIYNIALLFLKIPRTNEIFYVLSVCANYSLCVIRVICNGKSDQTCGIFLL